MSALTNEGFGCSSRRIRKVSIAMDQHQRHGALHEQHYFACTISGERDFGGGKTVGEPRLDRGFMLARNRTRGMATQVRKFNRDTCEAAAGPARLCRPFSEIGEECIDQFGRSCGTLELFEPLYRELTGLRQRRRHQIVFAAEMLIHGALGDAGASRNLVHRNPQEALPPEQAICRIQDAPMRLVA